MNTAALKTYRIIITLIIGCAAVFLFFPSVSLANALMSTIEGVLYKIVIVVFGGFAGISGVMLDYAVNNMVIGFGDIYLDDGLGYTIDSLWVVVRDIFNLTFIFGLVFIGLRLIFDSSSSSARKTLISLILAALLVNFSLFISKFIVDFSNIAALQLVGAFETVGGKAQISGSFMQLFGGASLFSGASLSKLVNDFQGFQGGAGLLYIFSTMVVLLIIAFVFMAGAILLMIRFVALNLYMLLSPLMFAGMVFPSAGRITQEFWSGFLGKAFFAPAYILMLYLAHKILSTFQVTGGGGLAQGFVSGNPVVIEQVLPPFILSAIFLVASIVIAQKMGATGADGAISVGKMLTGKAKRVVADKTLGVGARSVAKVLNSDTVTRANARINTAPGWAGKLARAGVATASLGALSKSNRQAIIQGSNSWSIAGSQSLSAKQKEERDIRTTDARVLTAAKTQQTIDAGMNSAAQLAYLRARKGLSIATPAELASLAGLEKVEQDMISAISGLAISDLEKIPASDWAKYAPHLTSSQVESAMKSDNLDQTTKNNIMGARKTAIENVIGKTGSIITKELTKLTIDQIETMGEDWIRDNVHLFSNNQMEELKKSKRYVPAQRDSFMAERKNWHSAAAKGTTYKGTSPKAEDLYQHKDSTGTPVGDRKPEDIANLGPDVLLDPYTAPLYLNDAALEIIGKKSTLSPNERSILKKNILALGYGPYFAEMDAYFKSTDGLRYFK